MSESRTTASGGVGICGLLGIAFIIMRLCGVIDWSWWWVTAPFWIPTGIVVILLIIAITINHFSRK